MDTFHSGNSYVRPFRIYRALNNDTAPLAVGMCGTYSSGNTRGGISDCYLSSPASNSYWDICASLSVYIALFRVMVNGMEHLLAIYSILIRTHPGLLALRCR